MPIRGDLWLSPVCGRGHHDDCQEGDNRCECGCHEAALAGNPWPSDNGAVAPDVLRAAVEEMRAEPPKSTMEVFDRNAHGRRAQEPVPCRVGCGKMFKARSGESIHFKYEHQKDTPPAQGVRPLDPNVGRLEHGRYRCTVCLSATFDTQRGVEVHYARCHGPKAVEKTAVPEGLPARPRAIVEPVPPAPKPAPADSARTREIDPDRQAFLDRMRAARDELADAEQAAERELAQMRTVIVALDGLLDSY